MNHSHTYSPVAPKNGIIGHRGLSGIAPENTLASFETAIAYGLSWIEFDIRLSKDFELMVIHDSRVERTTNQFGLVRDYTCAELNKMDAGSWFDSKFSDQFIPSLRQVVDLLSQTNVQMNIEIKTPNPPSAERLIKLSEVLLNFMQSWPNSLPMPVISCFDWTVLNRIRQFNPELPLGYLTDTCSEHMILEVSQLNNCALHCNAATLTTELITFSLQQNVPILSYTVNDEGLASDLLSQGIYGVFSDYPLLQENNPMRKKAS